MIDLRGCDMLVSAAAGSGKTAVLVERIISRIMEKKEPVDIDRLLVVTFTNAAAAEMRERILAALEEKLEQYPENAHLQRQVTLVHHAQITTIHSFCLDVIRNHFHIISLDPGFRIGDEGELKLLRHEVMENLLEAEYGKADPEFFRFAEAFAPGKSDQGLEDIISQFYDFSMGYPWPREWRQECLRAYCPESQEDMEKAPWMEALLRKLRLQGKDLRARAEEALKVIREPEGPWMYEEALLQDLERIGRLERCETYGDYCRLFESAGAFAALSRKKDLSVSEEKKEQVKVIRDQVKKAWKKLEEDYFFATPAQTLEDMRRTKGMVQVLLGLTDRFQEEYERQKAEKNIVDFNDLEHFALQILLTREGEDWVPSPAAREYAKHYQEIMIDEYQDSNLVQEILLTSVSGQNQGDHKIFMVGDVKQSIYRFRLARPELFMEKYESYARVKEEDGGRAVQRRIDLHKNFRSRHQVLEAVNLIFRQIMTTEVGGVEYDADAALYPGAVFEPRPSAREIPAGDMPGAEGSLSGTLEDVFLEPELLLVDAGNGRAAEADGETAGGKSPAEQSAENQPERVSEQEKIEKELRTQEAEAAGMRIRQIVGCEQVWDKERKAYRAARYSDVVILLRTVSGWAQTFAQVLGEMGIPAYTGGGTGYFSTLEIRTVLSFLRVLDNPRQDIPLAAVLRSPIGGLTGEELARLRISSPDTDFYTCCIAYAGRTTVADRKEAAEGRKESDPGEAQPGLSRKLCRFWSMVDGLRAMVPYTPMHLLLWRILEETGYGDYASAMPGGAQRKANLDMLVEKAVAYEATSYRGLFNFIRYIEQLQKYEIDYGEAGIGGEAADTVRIMSIHKSKGLEFPIVFLCGMGKMFNQQDSRSQLVLHPALGIGCDYTDPKLRVRLPLLVKKVISRQIQEENLGEELRVLYVAMTRAKEKLILMGSVKDPEEKLQRWSQEGKGREEHLSYSAIVSASCYLDWVVPALLRHRSGLPILRKLGLPFPQRTAVYEAEGSFRIQIVSEEGRQEGKQEFQEQLLTVRRELETLDGGRVYDGELHKRLEGVFAGTYPYEQNREIPGKLTVSQLKKMGRSHGTEDSTLLYQEPEIVPLIPRFKSGEEAGSGAARGTIYHRFLENMDFTGEFDRKFIDIQLETMVKCGKIQKDEAQWISRRKIRGFLDSGIALRMQQAARKGKLHREQPFVFGVSADQIRPEWDPGEEVLIQGIIDAWFSEGDTIVLVDYKTDFVPEGQDGVFLIRRYGLQLDYYQRALERLTGMRVKEKLIYSFYLNALLEVK